MIGCPHCEKNKSAWEQAKKKAGKMGYKVKETESQQAPMGMGFPTTRLEKDDGTPVGTEVVGPRTSGDQILKELGVKVPKKKVRKTRKSSRRLRRSRHSTLRNNVAFV